jgi:hypothetical protein
MTLRELARVVERVNIEAVAWAALAAQAELIAAAAEVATGVNLDVSSSDDGTVIGSHSVALLRREAGTVGEAPAPVLRRVAAAHAVGVATAVGEAVADALGRL